MTPSGSAFVEVSSPGWAFWRVLLDTGVGAVVGLLYAFLGILVVGVVGEEALSSLYRQVDLDPLFRASMGALLVVAGVLVLVVPIVFVAERFAALRAVDRAAARHPEAVPAYGIRAELVLAPQTHLERVGVIVFWCLAGLGALWALAVSFTEDLREDIVNWYALGVIAILAVIAQVLASAGRRRVVRDADRMEALWRGWRTRLPDAERRDADHRAAAPVQPAPRWLTFPRSKTLQRIAGWLIGATLIALAAFMLSVFLRQQCRQCDPITWDEPMENGIDVLSLASGVAIALCAALGALAWTGGVVLQFAREIAAARWVADGRARSGDLEAVVPLLEGHRAAGRLQRGLAAVGVAGIIVSTGAAWAEWTALDAPAVLGWSAAMILVGFLLGWADTARARRERQLVRDATFPGDAGRPEPRAAQDAGGRRSKRTRRR